MPVGVHNPQGVSQVTFVPCFPLSVFQFGMGGLTHQIVKSLVISLFNSVKRNQGARRSLAHLDIFFSHFRSFVSVGTAFVLPQPPKLDCPHAKPKLRDNSTILRR